MIHEGSCLFRIP